MQSKAKDVDTYLEEVPEKRQAALIKLRDLCVATLKGYEESMAYGMPSYKLNDTVEVAFASQKNYIALYILKKEVMEKHRASLDGLNVGKGCIRYTNPKTLDFMVVEQLLNGTLELETEIC